MSQSVICIVMSFTRNGLVMSIRLESGITRRFLIGYHAEAQNMV